MMPPEMLPFYSAINTPPDLDPHLLLPILHQAPEALLIQDESILA